MRDSVAGQATTDDVVVVQVAIEKSATLAAQITNQFVRRLETYLSENTLTRAQRYRGFLEGYVARVATDLETAEEALEQFKTEHGLLSLPDQVTSWIKRAAEIQAELETNRLTRDVLMQTLSLIHI